KNAKDDVTVTTTSITGLAPAAIRYSDSSIADLAVQGGTSPTTYSVTGSLGGASLLVSAESGPGKVVLSNNGRVNDASFPGQVVPLGFQGLGNSLRVDDSKDPGATTAVVTDGSVSGFTARPILLPAGFGFDAITVALGSASNTLTVNRSSPATVKADGALAIP